MAGRPYRLALTRVTLTTPTGVHRNVYLTVRGGHAEAKIGPNVVAEGPVDESGGVIRSSRRSGTVTLTDGTEWKFERDCGCGGR